MKHVKNIDVYVVNRNTNYAVLGKLIGEHKNGYVYRDREDKLKFVHRNSAFLGTTNPPKGYMAHNLTTQTSNQPISGSGKQYTITYHPYSINNVVDILETYKSLFTRPVYIHIHDDYDLHYVDNTVDKLYIGDVKDLTLIETFISMPT
ncbi:hypothetical protein CL653_03445 [bacterium]|nr:hypothetical protein [bacterium]|tara:strand:+ start:382 stop:825 length:444 start_codon:yes stop_codon:yes gene_type:complete